MSRVCVESAKALCDVPLLSLAVHDIERAITVMEANIGAAKKRSAEQLDILYNGLDRLQTELVHAIRLRDAHCGQHAAHNDDHEVQHVDALDRRAIFGPFGLCAKRQRIAREGTPRRASYED